MSSKIFCCGFAVSSESQIWEFHVVIWRNTSWNCTSVRAARAVHAARLVLLISTNHIIDWRRCRCHCHCSFLNSLLTKRAGAEYETTEHKDELGASASKNSALTAGQHHLNEPSHRLEKSLFVSHLCCKWWFYLLQTTRSLCFLTSLPPFCSSLFHILAVNKAERSNNK